MVSMSHHFTTFWCGEYRKIFNPKKTSLLSLIFIFSFFTILLQTWIVQFLRPNSSLGTGAELGEFVVRGIEHLFLQVACLRVRHSTGSQTQLTRRIIWFIWWKYKVLGPKPGVSASVDLEWDVKSLPLIWCFWWFCVWFFNMKGKVMVENLFPLGMIKTSALKRTHNYDMQLLSRGFNICSRVGENEKFQCHEEQAASYRNEVTLLLRQWEKLTSFSHLENGRLLTHNGKLTRKQLLENLPTDTKS